MITAIITIKYGTEYYTLPAPLVKLTKQLGTFDVFSLKRQIVRYFCFIPRAYT